MLLCMIKLAQSGYLYKKFFVKVTPPSMLQHAQQKKERRGFFAQGDARELRTLPLEGKVSPKVTDEVS